MRTVAICAAVVAAMMVAAYFVGRNSFKDDLKENVAKQVEIQRKTNDKVSNYTDNDYCTTTLRGRLSESGECE